ncbi:unnamed protein product [Candidula unifasciata]|uniref:Uncharacterized protein n=1 Tax=Candidula unifasciata TaxID=100452 RepID=A0A8S3Z8E6_9EUPU|nr:unnamed protein product [Candidula unifasciata]
MDVCIVAQAKTSIPLAERCHVVPTYVEDESPPGTNDLNKLIQNSLIPLLCLYISASLAVAFLVACIVVCIKRQHKKPKRIKPFYLTYPAWYDNRSSISGSSLVYDPHGILSGNLHTRSTLLADRLGFSRLDPDSSDLPSMVSSRRESRLCPGNHNCTCSTVISVLPHSGEESVTGQTEGDNEFFFHF